VIRAAGDDAVTFLQGQLTQDFALMGQNEARLAAFCNAKGRMQASFVVFKRGADVLLVCNRDILPATLKRLSMFVLRAKAKLSDASAEFALYGVAGETLPWRGRGPCRRPLGKRTSATQPGACIPAPARRAPCGAPRPGRPRRRPPPWPPDWQWLGVQSGIAMITQPIFEAFVPQMLNYESVGGVNFKKGCYPGQEIVARSQFRGTLKRRAYVAHTAGTPSVGQEVFHASDAGQPCGTVAAAAPNPAGGFDAIVSMQTSAAADAEGGRLTLGSASGEALSLLPLPYALLEDI
jgi:folate-binding protein YgfZ